MTPQATATLKECHSHLSSVCMGASMIRLLEDVNTHLDDLLGNNTSSSGNDRCDAVPHTDEDWVAIYGRVRAMNHSLDSGALRFAIMADRFKFACHQLEVGRHISWADLQLADEHGRDDFLQYALTSCNISQQDKQRALEQAASTGRMAILRALIADRTVDVNGDEETSPLKAAAQAGQIQAMKALIQAGAEIQAQPDREMFGGSGVPTRLTYAPLTTAVVHNQAEAVEVLLAAGADSNYQYYVPHHDPLQVAFTLGFSRILYILLTRGGARPDNLGLDDVWHSILMLAMKDGDMKLADIAIRKGVDVKKAIHAHAALRKHAVA